jgi:hypothetical protein
MNWNEIKNGWICETEKATLKVKKISNGFEWTVINQFGMVGGYAKSLLKAKKLAESKEI